jgi:DMSO/TMAO reductase YedYZ molybdopterin-dependent catalytic subunit
VFRQANRDALLLGALATAALAGALALAAAFQLASFVPLDIADAMIRVTPGAVATQGIESLGPLAKQMIELSGLVLFVLAGGLAAWPMRRLARRGATWAALALTTGGLALTALVQLIAGGLRGDGLSWLVTAALYLAWGAALAWLLARMPMPAGAGAAPDAGAPARRAFLVRSGGGLIAVALGSAALAQLRERAQAGSVSAQGSGQALPTAVATPRPARVPPTATPAVAAAAPTQAAGPTAAASAEPTSAPTEVPSPTPLPAFEPAPGTRSPFNTNATLYVISSSTRDPIVQKESWKLSIGGAVDAPFSLSYDELLALPRVDQTSTLECISNEVGNYLIGNCKWNGVRLRDLLERAGVQPGVIDIKLSAAEGYTESIPLEKAMDPTSIMAYGIDGEALAVKHGFPARLVVPGLYGEKNVKWLTGIEAVREDYQGYWQQRGWTDDATIWTTAVSDIANPFLGEPQPLAREQGIVPLGGIAFAGNRGISQVEVRIDDGPWQAATLDPAADRLTWRFWRYDWAAAPGMHSISVRASDGNGDPQTEQEREPHPDGASGYQTIQVEVV